MYRPNISLVHRANLIQPIPHTLLRTHPHPQHPLRFISWHTHRAKHVSFGSLSHTTSPSPHDTVGASGRPWPKRCTRCRPWLTGPPFNLPHNAPQGRTNIDDPPPSPFLTLSGRFVNKTWHLTALRPNLLHSVLPVKLSLAVNVLSILLARTYILKAFVFMCTTYMSAADWDIVLKS